MVGPGGRTRRLSDAGNRPAGLPRPRRCV